MREITFEECPRPQLVREGWKCLDGTWGFCFDPDNKGETQGYAHGFEKEYDILVPFAYQSRASGIGLEKRCDNVWYARTLTVEKRAGRRYVLHLEGADWRVKVYMNRQLAGTDSGGYHRMSFDITNCLHAGDNLLVIKCEDSYSAEQPRGKQRREDVSRGCFYVDTTGIWKTVWLEETGTDYITGVSAEPSLADGSVLLRIGVHAEKGVCLETRITYAGNEAARTVSRIRSATVRQCIKLPEPLHLWEVGHGRLYDVEVRLLDGETVLDTVRSYFGMREIRAENGRIFLNGRPLYQKLILDQGYFGECQLTPPSPRALYEDIQTMLAFGFNGARKHQKLEDERFYYYADAMGYLVWAEMPSVFECTARSRRTFRREWRCLVEQLRSHPCVIVWVPFNESWGVKQVRTDRVQQRFVNEIYYMTKDLDPSRLCVCNDGWEHTIGDLLTIHDYDQDGARLNEDFDALEKALADRWGHHPRGAYAQGYRYSGQPVLFTEFGGTAYAKNLIGDNWGYGNAVKDDGEYLARLKGLFDALNALKYSCGYCFTQLSDVQQEVNGLLTEQAREPKVSPELIKAMQDVRHE